MAGLTIWDFLTYPAHGSSVLTSSVKEMPSLLAALREWEERGKKGKASLTPSPVQLWGNVQMACDLESRLKIIIRRIEATTMRTPTPLQRVEHPF